MRTMKTVYATYSPKGATGEVFISERPLANDHPSNIREMDSLIKTLTFHEWIHLTGADFTNKATVHITVETEED